jgi:glycerol-3-phosphate dehydrogenase
MTPDTAPDAPAPFDLAVIGGGINGAGIARDASGRLGRVALIERGDLAQGTSSNSTKLIHGGLRYLEHYEFALVREALSERERLWAIAPHIIWPMRFVLPQVPGLRPRWLLRLGLFLYDHIGGRKHLQGSQGIDLTRHTAGRALKPELTKGFVYSDGWVDDARLVVLNAMDAQERGATVLTRTSVTALQARPDGLWQLTLASQNAAPRTLLARAVVNAAGPGVLDLLGEAGVSTRMKLRLVRGSHIVVPALFDHEFSYFFQLPDGRIIFAIPYEGRFTLIGTTDQDHEAGEPIAASAAEIAYLCDAASRFFAKPVTPADVVWTYAGVRPLLDDGSDKPEAATRGYRLDFAELPDMPGAHGAGPFLSVFGGKITTYRHLAEEAVNRLLTRMSVSPAIAVSERKGWTGRAPLPGGDFDFRAKIALEASLLKDHPFLSPEDAHRIASLYGTRARRWLGKARTLQDLGRYFDAGLTSAEVDYLIDHEWARSAEDILWRRTKLGLRFDAHAEAALADHIASRLSRKALHA